MDLQNKTIIITGASKGLGNAVAKSLWEQGASLFLVSRNKNENSETAFLSAKTHPCQQYFWCRGDLSDINTPKHVMKYFNMFFDHVDVLINNAATQQPIGNFCECNEIELRYAMNTNLLSAMMLTKYVLRLMIPRKSGNIINLAGGGATSTRPQFIPYAVSKTGLVRFTEILADEVKQYGIRVNVISPGVMNTQMANEIAQSSVNIEEKERAKLTIKTKETFVAPLALINWLLSDESDYVTGNLISAIWDDYQYWMPCDLEENNHWYKLRRIIPE